MTPREIKAQLMSMYPGYRFEIKDKVVTCEYSLLVFRDRKHLGTLDTAKNTSLDQFWATVKEWMLDIMRK